MGKKEQKDNMEKENDLEEKKYIEDFFKKYTPKIFNILKKFGEVIAPITFIAGIIGTFKICNNANSLGSLFGINSRYFFRQNLTSQYLLAFLIVLIPIVTFFTVIMDLEKKDLTDLTIGSKATIIFIFILLLIFNLILMKEYFFSGKEWELYILSFYSIAYITLVIIILIDKVGKKDAIAGLTIVHVGLLLVFLVTIFFGQSKLPSTYEMIDNNQVIVSVYQGKFVVMNSEVDESKNSISIEKGNYYLVDIDEVHVKTRTFDLVKVEEK